jgi:C4-dicarboxylate transporter, DctQ subunit
MAAERFLLLATARAVFYTLAVNETKHIPLESLAPGGLFILILAILIACGLGLHAFLVRRYGGERIDRWTRVAEGTLFTLFLVAMIVPSFLQVILRNFFHRGWIWLDPFVRTLVLWVGFLGALVATSNARHLHVDVVLRLLPATIHRTITRVLSVFCAFVCLLLANGAYTYLREEYLYGRSPFLGVPAWVAQSILLWGFILLAYRFMVQAIWPAQVKEPA